MRLAPVALLLALAAPACTHHIGDTCNTNVDCSPLGNRFCDVSAPSGYCTVEGCDVRDDGTGNLADSCPSEAVCVRFFSQIACKPCNPAVELDPALEHLCAADELCLCDLSDPAHLGECLPASPSAAPAEPDGGCPAAATDGGAPAAPSYPLLGHCAPASSERRWCQYSCNNNGDCRPGYTCVETGSRGAEPVPRVETTVPVPGDNVVVQVPIGVPAKFCAPSGQLM
jgi:hypothetical protein